MVLVAGPLLHQLLDRVAVVKKILMLRVYKLVLLRSLVPLYLRNVQNQAAGNTLRNGKMTFLGWNMMKIVMEPFVRSVENQERHF